MKRISLHIGLNQIDPDVYGPGNELVNCLNDCDAYTKIARDNGFTPTVLKDSEATCARVTTEIAKVASSLDNGDYFVVTYAGHGSQVQDEDNVEEDGMNETWVLYDRQMVDNELYCLWSKFKSGVKIFVLSDSCHSGTMMRPYLIQVQQQIRNLSPLSRNSRIKIGGDREVKPTTKQEVLTQIRSIAGEKKESKRGGATAQQRNRLLPPGASLMDYVKNRELYRSVMLLAGDKRDITINATLLYISGCQDNQTSGDGPAGTNGTFTGNLKKIWNAGSFTGTYSDFYDRICGLMPSDQSPNYMKLGVTNTVYEQEKPFVAAGTSVGSAPVSGGLTTPSLQIASQWKKSDGAPLFQVNKGGNPLYYVELATDKSLFNRAANEGNRTEFNFYASYRDPSVYEGGSFLKSSTPFQLPDAAWQCVKGAARIYYRIGTASDTSWSNFKISFPDKDYLNAPGFDLVSEGVTPVTPEPAPVTPTPEPVDEGSTSTVSISDSVGKNGANKRADVKIVQGLLNKVPSGEGGVSVKLVEDGLIGNKTINAIKGFQMYYGYDSGSDFGIIRPGSDTFYELTTRASRDLEVPAFIRGKSQTEQMA
jgi:metacaspase-1